MTQVLSNPFINYLRNNNVLIYYKNEYINRKSKFKLKNTFRSKEILIFLVSLISIFFVKFVTNGYGSFSIVKSIIKFSYFNLNIINFISIFSNSFRNFLKNLIPLYNLSS